MGCYSLHSVQFIRMLHHIRNLWLTQQPWWRVFGMQDHNVVQRQWLIGTEYHCRTQVFHTNSRWHNRWQDFRFCWPFCIVCTSPFSFTIKKPDRSDSPYRLSPVWLGDQEKYKNKEHGLPRTTWIQDGAVVTGNLLFEVHRYMCIMTGILWKRTSLLCKYDDMYHLLCKQMYCLLKTALVASSRFKIDKNWCTTISLFIQLHHEIFLMLLILGVLSSSDVILFWIISNNHIGVILCSSNATNNLTSKKQKVCSLCYRHAETRRRKGRKRCDLFYGGEYDKPTWSGEI